MKRKFKLITTIASLTAAIALLMFGVYAASTIRGVEISGSVSFEAQYVDATIKVYEGSALNLTALGDIDEGTAVASKSFVTGTGVADDQQMDDVELGLEELDDETLVYQYIVTVKNDGASALWVAFVVEDDDAYGVVGEAPAANLIAGLARTVTGATNSQSVAAGATVKLVVTYVVTPAQLTSWNITEFDFVSHVRLATNEVRLGEMVTALA